MPITQRLMEHKLVNSRHIAINDSSTPAPTATPSNMATITTKA